MAANLHNLLVEIRCTGMYYDKKTNGYLPCRKLLGKVQENADYQIKCPRCDTMNEKEKNN